MLLVLKGSIVHNTYRMDTYTFAAVFIVVNCILVLSVGLVDGIKMQSKFALQRAASRGDRNAKLVFALYGMRYKLQAVLVLSASIATVSSVLLVNAYWSGPLGIIFSAILLIVMTVVLPNRLTDKTTYILAKLYPVLTKLISSTSGVTKPLASYLERHDSSEQLKHSTKKELAAMLDSKDMVTKSDISSEEARMIRKVLEFTDKKIRDIMTPRRMVRIVSAEDELGPVLLDELHKAGHSRIPVTSGEGKEPKFVGTLFIRDLAVQKKIRKVGELMNQDVIYIHENESVDKALRAFLKTRHHLFVVVNNFQEFVGVLSIEDALEEIIGKEIVDESDTVEDLREAAQQQADAEVKNRSETA